MDLESFAPELFMYSQYLIHITLSYIIPTTPPTNPPTTPPVIKTKNAPMVPPKAPPTAPAVHLTVDPYFAWISEVNALPNAQPTIAPSTPPATRPRTGSIALNTVWTAPPTKAPATPPIMPPIEHAFSQSLMSTFDAPLILALKRFKNSASFVAMILSFSWGQWFSLADLLWPVGSLVFWMKIVQNQKCVTNTNTHTQTVNNRMQENGHNPNITNYPPPNVL